MAVLTIEDPEAIQLAAELSRKTGKSLGEVVVQALRREAALSEKPKPIDRAWLEALQDRVAKKLPAPEQRKTPDEIIGYDERGLP